MRYFPFYLLWALALICCTGCTPENELKIGEGKCTLVWGATTQDAGNPQEWVTLQMKNGKPELGTFPASALPANPTFPQYAPPVFVELKSLRVTVENGKIVLMGAERMEAAPLTGFLIEPYKNGVRLYAGLNDDPLLEAISSANGSFEKAKETGNQIRLRAERKHSRVLQISTWLAQVQPFIPSKDKVDLVDWLSKADATGTYRLVDTGTVLIDPDNFRTANLVETCCRSGTRSTSEPFEVITPDGPIDGWEFVGWFDTYNTCLSVSGNSLLRLTCSLRSEGTVARDFREVLIRLSRDDYMFVFLRR